MVWVSVCALVMCLFSGCGGRDTTNPEDLYRRFLAGEITSLDENGTAKPLASFFLERANAQEYTYTYLDMTGDGVSELCVRYYLGMYFFTVENGEISHWYTEHNSYSTLLNNGALLFERHGAAPTHVNYEYYELDENAAVKFSVDFSWWSGRDVEEGTVYPDTYWIGEREVAKQEYEAQTTKYLEIGSDRIVWYDAAGNPV